MSGALVQVVLFSTDPACKLPYRCADNGHETAAEAAKEVIVVQAKESLD